jgi:DNA-binding transcriptional regulator LsrR (DeoR family)
MRHIREVLRLHYSVGMSQRAVARSLGLAQGTVSKYLNRTRRAGLTWPLPPELYDDVRLENRLYPHPIGPATSVHSPIGRSCIASCGARTSR